MTRFEARQEISHIKNLLTLSDYRVIKNIEYKAVGKEAPYDIKKLHAERQALRDQINVLEELIPTLTEEGGIF